MRGSTAKPTLIHPPIISACGAECDGQQYQRQRSGPTSAEQNGTEYVCGAFSDVSIL